MTPFWINVVAKSFADLQGARMSEIELPEPAAWLVKAQYPFVEMRPPIEGGLPREPLFTAEQVRHILAAERERHRVLLECAEDVVARWNTPLWKDVAPTADYIYRLRDAAEAIRKASAATPR